MYHMIISKPSAPPLPPRAAGRPNGSAVTTTGGAPPTLNRKPLAHSPLPPSPAGTAAMMKSEKLMSSPRVAFCAHSPMTGRCPWTRSEC